MQTEKNSVDDKYYFPHKIYRAILNLYYMDIPSGMSHTHFTFPRRVGKTTAIANFFAYNSDVVVIVPNRQMREVVVDTVRKYYNSFPEDKFSNVVTVDEFKNWSLGKDITEFFWVYEGTNMSLERDMPIILNLTKFRGSRNGVFIT